MFGSMYANHLEFLKQSFRGMNDEYRGKVKKKESFVMTLLQSIYIQIFGVPEIGFQVRHIHFQKALKLTHHKEFTRILDAGSGIGCYTLALARRYPRASVFGVDTSKKSMLIGKTMAKAMSVSNATFTVGNLENPMSERFDFIVCIDVLEHIENYKKVLKNFYRLLKRGGYLYIHVPQMHQKRFFKQFRTWSHEGHVREGYVPSSFQKDMKNIGFQKIGVWNTFGVCGSLAWELNHLALSKSFIVAALTYPFLLPLIIIDRYMYNKKGLAASYLYRKI